MTWLRGRATSSAERTFLQTTKPGSKKGSSRRNLASNSQSVHEGSGRQAVRVAPGPESRSLHLAMTHASEHERSSALALSVLSAPVLGHVLHAGPLHWRPSTPPVPGTGTRAGGIRGKGSEGEVRLIESGTLSRLLLRRIHRDTEAAGLA